MVGAKSGAQDAKEDARIRAEIKTQEARDDRMDRVAHDWGVLTQRNEHGHLEFPKLKLTEENRLIFAYLDAILERIERIDKRTT